MKNVNYIFLLLISLIVIKIDKINAQNTECPKLYYVTNSTVCQGKTAQMEAYGYGATITGHKWYTSESKISFVNYEELPNSGYDYMSRVTASTPVTYYVANVCGSSESTTLLKVTASFTAPVTPSISISSSSISGSNGPEPYINTCTGTSITFTSSTSQSGNYQWYRNGSPIPGANSDSYTSSTFTDNDLITVKLSNIIGTCLTSSSASSEGIRIRVESFVSPSVKIEAPTSACSNATVLFKAQPTDGGSYPIFRWTLDEGTPESSGSRLEFSKSNLTAGSHTMKVEMESSQRCVRADSKKVYFTKSIYINQLENYNPEMLGDSEICPGSATGFTIYPNTSMSFEWTKNGYTVGTNSTQYFEAGTVKNDDLIACRVKTNGAFCVAPIDVTLKKTIKEIQIQRPQIEIRFDDAYICESRPVTFKIYPKDVFSGYSWSISGGGISGSGTESTFSTLFNKLSEVTVTATAKVGCAITHTAYASLKGSDYPIVASPSIISTTPSSRCGAGKVTLEARASSGIVVWYSTLTGGNALNYGSSYAPSIPSTSTYYVGAEEYGCSSASRTAITATVKSLIPPSITGDDGSVGGNCTYTTEAEMSAYTWTVSGGTIKSGAGTRQISVTWGSAGKGYVSVNFSNANGCRAETATKKEVTIYSLPEIIQQPLDVSQLIGNSASFSVKASGTNLSYQWKKNGDDIPGATSDSYTIPRVKLSDAGLYNVIISGAGKGSVTSNSAKLDVNPLPTDQNYVISYTVQKEGVTDVDNVGLLSEEEMQKSITYYDGLGRPMQQVIWRGSPARNDIIQPIAYDEYGRESIKYLPYIDLEGTGFYRTNALNSTYASSDHFKFYTNGYGNAVDAAYDMIGSTENTYNAALTGNSNVVSAGAIILSPGFSTKGYTFSAKIVPIADLPEGGITENVKPYSLTVFEPSPLNRVLEQGAPGADWQPLDNTGNSNGHTNKITYTTNDADKVQLWKVDNSTGALTRSQGSAGFYGAGTLFVTVTKNENWKTGDNNANTSVEYKDFAGNVVLKTSYASATDEISTYYVYDDMGRLRYVLPPEAYAGLGTATSVSSDVINNLCFSYTYDERGRIIEKRLPGVEPIYMVYDKLNRLVLSQDGNMRNAKNSDGSAKNQWSFTKYDKLSRPILTGTVNYPSTSTRATLQNSVNRQALFGETRNVSTHGYTLENTYPILNASVTYEVLNVTYYDDYDFDNNGTPDKIYANVTGYTNQPFNRLTGNVTGTKTKILGTDSYLKSFSFYDKYNRVIQSYSQNYLNGGDQITTDYAFSGEMTKTIHQQYGTDISSITTEERFIYDHARRVKETYHKVYEGNGAATATEVKTSQLTYNELGQLTTKKLHANEANSTYAQKLDYKYNIRGWLKSINNPNDLLSSTEKDAFGMQLLYNNVADLTTSAIKPASQFNGNIAGVEWKNSYDNVFAGYSYNYDNLSRLKEGIYIEKGTSWAIPATNKYTEKISGYDKNGNIKNLERYSKTGLMDNLTYAYGSGTTLGNKLLSIQDASEKAEGFLDKANTAAEYTYDKNGNLTRDDNKGITAIEYNQLNLPSRITFGAAQYIEYIYTASGQKLAKKITNGTTINYRYYIGNTEYDNNKAFAQLSFSEGRIIKPGTAYSYEYFVKDHLGNTRALVQSNGTILQASSYYPFGLQHLPVTPNNDNKYLYNGKELQSQEFSILGLDWYDYGARFYDPMIGRWHSVDDYAEYDPDWSPYRYCYDNPISYTDPDGNWEMRNGNFYTSDYNDILSLWSQIKSTNQSTDQLLNYIEKSYNDQVKFEKDVKAGRYGTYLGEATVNGNGKSKSVSVKDTRSDFAYLWNGLDETKNPYIWTDKELNTAAKTEATVASLFLPVGEIAEAGAIALRGLKAVEEGANGLKSLGAAAKGFSKIPKGFKEVKQFGYQHGQKVYEYMGKYYSKDIDSHSGGVWKVFEVVGGTLKRIGTADETLTIFKK